MIRYDCGEGVPPKEVPEMGWEHVGLSLDTALGRIRGLCLRGVKTGDWMWIARAEEFCNGWNFEHRDCRIPMVVEEDCVKFANETIEFNGVFD